MSFNTIPEGWRPFWPMIWALVIVALGGHQLQPQWPVANAQAANAAPNYDSEWWHHAVIYQVYPRSFRDSNGDGVGDLTGILQKFDHFLDMGVNAIWLSSVYKSPQYDQGYDVSNYREIDPIFGTLKDFQRLLDKAKSVGIKVLMDFVPNHSSVKHEWFEKSASAAAAISDDQPNAKYADYYVWADCGTTTTTTAGDDNYNVTVPPNNWQSVFGGSAWTYEPARNQCYLHQFSDQQPDLNYRNSDVLDEMKKILLFWLELGVDGFRVDAVPFLFEDANLSDEKNSPAESTGYGTTEAHEHTQNLNETYHLVYEARKLLDQYSTMRGNFQRIMVTEAYGTYDTVFRYYGTSDGSQLGAHLSFNFMLIDELMPNGNSTAADIVTVVNQTMAALSARYVPNWVLGNHDQRRAAGRYGRENVDGFNMLVGLLPGVMFTYNGEELGMEDVYVPFDQHKDQSVGATITGANQDLTVYNRTCRDFERTPFPWDGSKNAGFSTANSTWLPIGEQYKMCNLADQKRSASGKTHFNIYKAIVALRRNEIILQKGHLSISSTGTNILLLNRTLNNRWISLVFNVGHDEDVFNVVVDQNSKVLISSSASKWSSGSIVNLKNFTLAPHEALVLEAASNGMTIRCSLIMVVFSIVLFRLNNL